MTAVITWEIRQLDRRASDGGVVAAHWSVTAVDEGQSASTYGVVGFTPDPTSPDFKPYDNLTKDDVLSWVWGSVDKADVETCLQAEVDLKKAPATLTGTPW